MAGEAAGRVRLQRILAAAGLGSRRGCEEFLRTGRVAVNGVPSSLGDSADPSVDVVTLDGERVHAERLAYWIVNKPRGVVTTVRDPEGRPTIVELVPGRGLRLFPIGRLDRDTEGLVILTNDGPLAHALLHPSHGVEREYAVVVRGALSADAVRRLATGVRLEDGVTALARVSRVETRQGGETTSLQLTLIEGRKRQIRRSLESLGHRVISLRRIRMGSLLMGKIDVGAARPLSAAELRDLVRGTGLEGPSARRSGRNCALGRGNVRV